MSDSTVRNDFLDKFRRDLALTEAQMRQAKMAEKCVEDNNGQLIRGYVTKARCLNPKCRVERWDDGTRCWSCKKYAKDVNTYDAILEEEVG